jgi:phage terminase Nu1 subunit (DNA packaging protein)
LIELDKQVSQREFAAIIGVSEPAVSGLIKRGIIQPEQSLGVWLLAYCSHLREQAAGRSIELSEERAGLAREQKLLARIRKQKELEEWAPIANITLVLSKATAQMASIFDGIPIQLKRQFADLTAEQLNVIREELAKARNLMVRAGTHAAEEVAIQVADYVGEFDDGSTTEE